MQQLFVPYELTLLLKEKGFSATQYFAAYIEYRGRIGGRIELDIYQNRSDINFTDSEQYDELIEAPLYQQVIDWFREKNIWIVEYPKTGWEVVSFLPNRVRGEMELPIDKAIEAAIKLIKK